MTHVKCIGSNIFPSIHCRGLFKALQNINNEAFCKISSRFKGVNYFRKKLHHGYLAGSKTQLCFAIVYSHQQFHYAANAHLRHPASIFVYVRAILFNQTVLDLKNIVKIFLGVDLICSLVPDFSSLLSGYFIYFVQRTNKKIHWKSK